MTEPDIEPAEPAEGDLTEPAEGDLIDLEIGPVAHGGHCVARHLGRVYFVRHCLPGERVRARVRDLRERFGRADAVEILRPAPERVEPPCRYAHPGGCGGCDWQHTDLTTQRRLKARVVLEQLTRLGRLDPDTPLAGGRLADLTVQEVPGARPDGTGWRTRVRFTVTPDGRLGLRGHRSHEVQTVDRCLLASDPIDALDLPGRAWSPWEQVEAVGSGSGDLAVVLDGPASARPPDLPRQVAVHTPGGRRGRGHVREPVTTPAGRRLLRVSGSGFWQVHPGAPDALLGAVLDQLDPRPGQRLLDLYCGVGLFSVGLVPLVGARGEVLAVESDAGAVRDARRNLHDAPQVRLRAGRVEKILPTLHTPVDGVVLDPPRAGAGRRVLDEVVRLTPATICYVACDPASLGRDTALLTGGGYRLTALQAFDLFPHTHHVECVARFTRVGPGQGP